MSIFFETKNLPDVVYGAKRSPLKVTFDITAEIERSGDRTIRLRVEPQNCFRSTAQCLTDLVNTILQGLLSVVRQQPRRIRKTFPAMQLQRNDKCSRE